jgi:predicted nucleotidyltransferase
MKNATLKGKAMNANIKKKDDILLAIQENEGKIKNLGAKRIGLFGSFIRGEQNDESDVDLLVEFEEGQKTFDNFMRISFLLEEILQRPVELVTAESLSPYIRPYVIKEVEYVTL